MTQTDDLAAQMVREMLEKIAEHGTILVNHEPHIVPIARRYFARVIEETCDAIRTTRPAASEDDAELVKRLMDLADYDARSGEPLGRLMREAAARIETLSRENAELHERLEDNRYYDSDGNRVDVTPGSIPDGIHCRDETIRLLDAKIADARRQALEEAAAELAKWQPDEDAAGGPANWSDFVQVGQSAIRNLIGEKS